MLECLFLCRSLTISHKLAYLFLNARLDVQVHGVRMAQEGSSKSIGLLEVHQAISYLALSSTMGLFSSFFATAVRKLYF